MQGLVFYNEYYGAGVGVNSVSPVNSTQADLYLTNVGVNTSTISNSSCVLDLEECAVSMKSLLISKIGMVVRII